jgi:glycosyltransferase involved in cell wall biosynthesis
MSTSRRQDEGIVTGPKVSVIMAVYNGARYLAQAMDSVLAQSFTDLEFVVVNDGSTDETAAILDGYQDPRIVLVEHDQNMGLTRSLNRGIDASCGELLARQDADDYSLPERLARQVAFMDAHPAVALVGSGSKWIDGQGAVIRDGSPPTDPVTIQQQLLSSVPFLHGTFMIRRSCLGDVGGGYNEAFPVAQDCDLFLQISERWELANLPDILYVHRRHADTVTARRRADQERYLKLAQDNAVQRRLRYGWGRLGLLREQVPEWVLRSDRRWLAQRFVWWSAGARGLGKRRALQFLLIALLLEPTTPEIWSYVRGILLRKTGLARR